MYVESGVCSQMDAHVPHVSKYILSSCLDTFAFIMTAKYTGKVIVFIGLKLGTESRAADFNHDFACPDVLLIHMFGRLINVRICNLQQVVFFFISKDALF